MYRCLVPYIRCEGALWEVDYEVEALGKALTGKHVNITGVKSIGRP